MSMKEDRRTSKIVNEGGSEIKLWLNTKEDLLIEIKNMKSFNEQRRVFVFIKTMLNMYLSYILNPKTALQRRLFEKVDAYVNEIYEDKDDVFEESVEEEEMVEVEEKVDRANKPKILPSSYDLSYGQFAPYVATPGNSYKINTQYGIYPNLADRTLNENERQSELDQLSNEMR